MIRQGMRKYLRYIALIVLAIGLIAYGENINKKEKPEVDKILDRAVNTKDHPAARKAEKKDGEIILKP
jgi:hypothetical protein